MFMSLINSIFSFNFWMIICMLCLICLISTAIRGNLALQAEISAKRYDYDENKILNHLDFLIMDAITRYNILVLAPRQIFYITDVIQDEIIDYLVNNIPRRISPSLMNKLSLVCNPAELNTYIGEHIHLMVTNFVLNYNINGTNVPTNNPENTTSVIMS